MFALICEAFNQWLLLHYSHVMMSAMASPITSLTTLYSTVYSGSDQRKHQSSASLAFVRGIHRWPVNPPHKGQATRNMLPFDDVIMLYGVTIYLKFRFSFWFDGIQTTLGVYLNLTNLKWMLIPAPQLIKYAYGGQFEGIIINKGHLGLLVMMTS